MPTKPDISIRNRSIPVKDKLLEYRESAAYMAPDGDQLPVVCVKLSKKVAMAEVQHTNSMVSAILPCLPIGTAIQISWTFCLWSVKTGPFGCASANL